MSPTSRGTSFSDYNIKIVSTLEEFAGLKEVWNEMAYNNPRYAPFMCHEWFTLWLNHFLNQNNLFIILINYNDKPVSIAPFMITRCTFRRLKVNKLQFINNIYSPAVSLLYKEPHSPKNYHLVNILFTYLFTITNKWHIFELSPIDRRDPTFHYLDQTISVCAQRTISQVCFIRSYQNGINSSAQEYLANLPKTLRKKIKRRRKRLTELGTLYFTVINTDNNIDRYMDHYYHVYSKSWKKEEISKTFHRDLAKLAAAKGWLRLGLLFLDDTPIATNLCLVHNHTVFFLKTAYDPAYRKFGPGVIVKSDMIQYIMEHDDIGEIDLGAGIEESKKSWVSQSREIMKVFIFNRNIKSQLLSSLETQIIPFLRKSNTIRRVKSRVFSKHTKNFHLSQ